ncbi:MAG TPA: hypothetical protein VEN81_07700, partial [Planctomycetota bacterium]|nr:hypothetical protein [Planctomycetota bacterium]
MGPRAARGLLFLVLVLLVPACGGSVSLLPLPVEIRLPLLPAAPGAFDLAGPGSGNTLTTARPTYTWTASSGATSYTLQVSTSSAFSSYVVNQPGITGVAATPEVNLVNSQTYWWRVTSVNAFGSTSATTAPWSFTIGPATFTFIPGSLSFTCTEGGANPADQGIQMTDTGNLGSGITWTATSDQPWLTVSPPSGGSTPTQMSPLTVHVNATYQGEAWTGPTSTVNAPINGLGDWTGNALLVWNDPSTPGIYYNPATDTWSGTTSTQGSPSSRIGFTALWTGTEMIVWGGLTQWNGTALNTGARYNPATDTWTPMSTVGAPSGRFEHMVVWTGSRMIVWGGEQPSYDYFNTGAIYDPATDTWTGATTQISAPSVRGDSAAVWNGTRMILWGGEDPSPFATGYYYDPAADAWTGTTTLVGAPAARSHMPGVWTGREMIVWGGGSGGPHLNTGARYNPALDAWSNPTTTTGAPAGRASFVGIWTGQKMLVWGGEINGVLTNTGGFYQPPIPAFGPNPATLTISATG